jgi:Rab-GTPase-TBC domain
LTIEIFSGFIVDKCLIGLYSGQVSEFHLQAFILDRCIAYSLPELHLKLKRLNVKLEMFTCEWIMTFFCGFFSRNSSLSFAVLDNVMVDGWSAVYRISIALLRYLESNLLKAKDIGQVSEQINNFRTVQINDLLLLASYEVISPDLDQYRLDYFTKLVGEKLVQDRKEWSRIDQGLLPALEERLKCFVKPIQNEIALRQKRIV